MSVRLRISVLRLRQLSAMRRLYDASSRSTSSMSGSGVGVGSEPAAGVVELAPGATRIAALRLVAGSREMVEATQAALALAREPEDPGEGPCGGEVLAALEVALRLPERRPHAGLGRWPVIHGRCILESRRDGRSLPQRRTDRARHRDARRAGLHALERGDPPLRLHATSTGARCDYFTRELEELGFDVERGPGRHARRAQPPAGRARLRDRLALRLEPQRRQLRRHDGRRHRARGLPAERGARPRPAAPARSRSSRRRARASARCCSAAGSSPSA